MSSCWEAHECNVLMQSQALVLSFVTALLGFVFTQQILFYSND